jgi:glyoxylase-like metal-dependent hydrolase (beta-lactamase superfamily II)
MRRVATMRAFPIVHRVAGKFRVLPDHVNAYVAELDHECAVVDATIALSSAGQLVAIAQRLDKPIRAVLITNGHPDHYSGLKVFEQLPRYASRGCLDFARKEDAEKGSLGRQYHGDDYPDPRVFPNKIIQDGAQLIFDGYTFAFSDLGPGNRTPTGCGW